MTKVITFGNFKGGVGKTMTIFMTALDLSKDGRKVLFIDSTLREMVVMF